MTKENTQASYEMEQNRYIYTCMYNCEKGIYEQPSLNSNSGALMLDNCFDHSVSYENAFAARELQLERLLTKCKNESPKTLMTNISKNEKENILEKVFSYELTPNVKKFAEEYKQMYGKRSDFLWKWLGVVYRDTGVTLSTVNTKYLDSITDTKIIFTMLFSILDDVSEFYKDGELMEELLEIICENNSTNPYKNRKTAHFKKLWNHFNKEIQKLPRYDDFKDMFNYDLKQMVNSVRFSYLMNEKPQYMNLQEMEFYGSFNMIVFLLNGIDLMASPDFDEKELTHMRTVFWNAQQMARIGNWLSTWKREVEEDDVCSGVFAYALSKNVITVDDLNNMKGDKIIKKIENSDMQDYFINTWQDKFDNIKDLKSSIKSVDMNQYIKGLETLIKLHMASEGFK